MSTQAIRLRTHLHSHSHKPVRTRPSQRMPGVLALARIVARGYPTRRCVLDWDWPYNMCLQLALPLSVRSAPATPRSA